jgi:hypothetical protein
MCKYLYKSESMWLSQQTQQVPLFTCPHLDPSSDVSAPNPTNRLIYNEWLEIKERWTEISNKLWLHATDAVALLPK